MRYHKSILSTLILLLIGVIFGSIISEVGQAAIYRSLMMNSSGQNQTPITELRINGVSIFEAVPTASQYLQMNASADGIIGVTISSSVTGSGGVNSGNFGAIAYYITNPTGATISPLTTLANAVLATDSTASPYMTTTLPSTVQQNITILGDLSQGVSGTTGEFSSSVTAEAFFGDGSNLSGISGVITSSTTGYIAYYKEDGAISGMATLSGDSIFGGDLKVDNISGVSELVADVILGGISKYFVYSGITITSDMLASGSIYWDSTTMGGVTLPAITGNTAFVLVKDIQGAGVSIFTENNQSILEDGSWGTLLWVAPDNLGHQIALTAIMTGTSVFWDVLGFAGSNWTLE